MEAKNTRNTKPKLLSGDIWLDFLTKLLKEILKIGEIRRKYVNYLDKK